MLKNLDFKLFLAMAGVAIIWGTTYLGISLAVETIPGWYVTSIRQFLAAFILMFYLIYKNQLKWVSWKYFNRQLLLALFMVVVANGFTTLAEKTVPSGLAALVNSLSPILVFVASAALGYQKPTIKSFGGVLLGFLGVVFLFRDGVSGLFVPEYRTGVLLLGGAITGWTIGTIYTKRTNNQSQGIFLDLFYQFFIAGVVQLVLALNTGNSNFEMWSLISISATLYLAVFGSIVGFFCYNYALKRVSASEVSILTYFNTVIALFLGWLVLDEVITIDVMIATFLIIVGVFITNYQKSKN
ncbi:DMT family transporter [Pedobacter flavus]|uniref:EamA family transporter n=1 Tax=Pedobacter flavus TaxID=3113906 RepID=A0ABU7H3P5_9SPHI|nr:EamA family transporter [Pedobacter sp. VNH31]MEE1885885.1 EamA family transporter [Pedobacter sp. VNH31]